MKFVIGGAFQGKREAACRLFGCDMDDFIDGRDCTLSEIYTCRAICNFHEYIRRCVEEDCLDDSLAEKLFQQNPHILIVSDEIGYGIVPIDAGTRRVREQTGRICCQIAEKADVVVRVLAGIPMFLKGEYL